MKKILIYGAGGFGREVQWLIEQINCKKPTWKIEGYLDDRVEIQTEVNGYRVLGGIEKLKEYDSDIAVVVAVCSAKIRKNIISTIKELGDFEFPNLIAPDVKMSETISMGEGNIICAGNILTINIRIADYVIVNLSCMVSHDVVLESFVTVHPKVTLSANARMEQGVELGTGSRIIEGLTVGKDTIVGAGAVVVRNLPSKCVAMGIPARPSLIRGRHRKLLIVGNSGHGKVIGDLASQLEYYQSIQFLDDNPESCQEERVVIGNSQDVFRYKDECDVIVAIGDANIRRQLQESYETAGVSMVSLIHRDAILPKEMPTIGGGTVVMAGSVIQMDVVIGKGVIVNTAASIDHDCRIGDYVHIAVGAHLAGNVKVGNNTWIGAGTVVSNNVSICQKVIIGAGAVVVKDIVEEGTYVGVPARKI